MAPSSQGGSSSSSPFIKHKDTGSSYSPYVLGNHAAVVASTSSVGAIHSNPTYTTSSSSPSGAITTESNPALSKQHQQQQSPTIATTGNFPSSLRLSRRLSHPSLHTSRLRSEQEDGEFIKRAFERLAVENSSQQGVSSSRDADPANDNVDDPAFQSALSDRPSPTPPSTTLQPSSSSRTTLTVQSTPYGNSPPEEIPLTLYPNQSRASIASTTSHPFSAASTFSYGDGASVRSSYPLLAGVTPTAQGDRHGNGNGNGISDAMRLNNNDGPSPPSLGVDILMTSHLRSPSWSSQASGLASSVSPSRSIDNGSSTVEAFLPPPHHQSPHDTGSTVNNTFHNYAPISASDFMANTDISGPSGSSNASIPWSDPFTDAAEQARSSRLRLRRSSTISGYSVSSQDWSSLRRGSLPSLDGTVPSYQQSSHRIFPGHTTVPGGPTNSETLSQQQSLSGTVTPRDHSNRQQIMQPSAQQNSVSSMRWEAWAAAYRESVIQQRHLQNPFLQVRRGSRDWIRQPSIVEEPSVATLERDNTFYRLRRQFAPRAGSRGEANRILVLELCHALEEYAGALSVLWRTAQAESPRVRLASLVAVPLPVSGSVSGSSASGQNRSGSSGNGAGNSNGNGRSVAGSSSGAGNVSSPEKLSQSDSSPDSPTFPLQLIPPGSGSPGFARILSTNVDKAQIELLADEVDSLVREIIEAVPAFSSSLSQGHYGPLPFAINTQHTTAEDINIQSYLELISVIPSSSSYSISNWGAPTNSGASHGQRQPVFGTLGLDPMAVEAEQDAISMSKWWPSRLRTDLREGLLVDEGQDSPVVGLQTIPTMSTSTIPIRSARENPRDPTRHLRTDNASAHANTGEGHEGTSDRHDQLLAEGRRRWREYVRGRT